MVDQLAVEQEHFAFVLKIYLQLNFDVTFSLLQLVLMLLEKQNVQRNYDSDYFFVRANGRFFVEFDQ